MDAKLIFLKMLIIVEAAYFNVIFQMQLLFVVMEDVKLVNAIQVFSIVMKIIVELVVTNAIYLKQIVYVKVGYVK